MPRNSIGRTLNWLFLALAFISFASAYGGSSGNISSLFATGMIGTNAGNSLNASVYSLPVIGVYSGAYAGGFGLSPIGTAEVDVLDFSSLSPMDNSGSNDTIIMFMANVSGQDIRNCTLMIDDANDMTLNYPAQGLIEFTTSLAVGNYRWKIRCLDTLLNQYDSEERHISILAATSFSPGTTDFSAVDMTNITNLTLIKAGLGKVVFDENVNLSAGRDLNSIVVMGGNSFYVDSASAPELNRPATINLYGLGIDNPVILRDGLYCGSCSILSYNGNITFTVPGFSNYTVTENSELSVWDDTDYAQRLLFDDVRFYANYTSVSTGLPITGPTISCNISIDGIGSFILGYNLSSGLYEYNTSLPGTGTYPYSVICDDSSDTYTGISLADNAVIMASIVLGAGNVTVIKNERGNISSNPGTINIERGNVSSLGIESISLSPSWQGFYGNVSGAISLQTPAGEVLYDWSNMGGIGEVYASRSPSVDFATVDCTDLGGIAAEEAFLGQTANDSDSVTRTFNKTAHPAFRIGNVNITQDICRSTNIYVNGTSQDQTFFEVLVSDAAENLVYTAIMEQKKT
ncbi:MAG: hypothetical protein HGA85_06805, partial [Nanoarchaeota archaeon]|nr:hypothetical protein [Nanoarchaeota archaeon]